MPDTGNPEFLRRAIRLATENVATGKGGPFAAVIVRDGKIVGEGVNTVTASHDPTAHGEVNAIRAAATCAGNLFACRMRTLHQLRALPHVPGRVLTGPVSTQSTTEPVPPTRRAPALTTRFSTRSYARKMPPACFPRRNCWELKPGQAFRPGSTRPTRSNIDRGPQAPARRPAASP